MKRLIVGVSSALFLLAGPRTAIAQAQRISADIGIGTYRPVPPPDMLLVMVRSTLLAVGHGNLVNDYAVVWKLAAKSFQKKFDGATISKLLEPIRTVGLNHHALAVATPQFQEVRIDDAGSLRMTGVVALQQRRLEFRLLFEAEEDGWRLSGMAFAALPPAEVSPAPQQSVPTTPQYIVVPPLIAPTPPGKPQAKPVTVTPEVKPKRADATERLESFSRTAVAAHLQPQLPALEQLGPLSVAETRTAPSEP